MSAWRVAGALLALRDEIDQRSPDRSTASDGFLGNAAHAARESDHNPWVKDGSTGVVTAGDFTNDPAHGFDSSDFADWLRRRCQAGTETRVKYVISDRRIASATHQNWAWRAYTGANPHEHHVHVSVLSTKNRYDNTSPWGWDDQEDDMELTDTVELTQAQANSMNLNLGIGDTKFKPGDKVKVSRLLVWGGPGIERLYAAARANAAQLGALNATLKAVAGAVSTGGGLTAQQAEAAAEAGARAALDELGDRLTS